MAERVFKPAENVPQSGLYLVVHDNHRPDHEATLFQGEQFPACAQCDVRVRFKLLRAASPEADGAGPHKQKARGHSRTH